MCVYMCIYIYIHICIYIYIYVYTYTYTYTYMTHISGSGDNVARLWSATGGKSFMTLSGHSDRVLDSCRYTYIYIYIYREREI